MKLLKSFRTLKIVHKLQNEFMKSEVVTTSPWKTNTQLSTLPVFTTKGAPWRLKACQTVLVCRGTERSNIKGKYYFCIRLILFTAATCWDWQMKRRLMRVISKQVDEDNNLSRLAAKSVPSQLLFFELTTVFTVSPMGLPITTRFVRKTSKNV